MRTSHRRGFSLVELLVVIGLIAVLLGLLMPALAKAQKQAKWVRCQSNMRQIGFEMLHYANSWRGWMYPPGMRSVTREQQWPTIVLKPPQWNHPILLCPMDEQPQAEHSYILNYHLVDHGIRYGSGNLNELTPSDIVVMGEKLHDIDDYYMNTTDFPTRVDLYKHGVQLGSNYLFLDLHVSRHGPTEAIAGVDPWDLPTP